MKVDRLIICTFMFKFDLIKCTKNSETEDTTTSKTIKLDECLLEPPKKRHVYEQLYQGMNYQNLYDVRLWTALDKKSPNQLFLIAQHLAKCVRKEVHALQVDIEYKTLSYPLRHYRTQIVAMLRCKIGKNVYRFIEGNENYGAFLVLKRSSANESFFIAAACLRSKLPHLEFSGLESTNNGESEMNTISEISSACSKYVLPDLDFHGARGNKYGESGSHTIFMTKLNEHLTEPFEKRYVYEKLYHEANYQCVGNIRLWPITSKKSPDQLIGIARYLTACLGIKEYIHHANVDYKALMYPLRYYSTQTVAMLRCRMGKNVYHFIEGDENYHAFMVLKVSSNSKRFFIASACLKSTIPPSQIANVGGSRKRQFEFQGLSEILDHNGQNEANLEIGNKVVEQLKCQEPVEKLHEYEKIHHNKYVFKDLIKYESWPLIENRSPRALFNLAKAFTTCVGIDEPIENMFIKEEKRVLQYSIKIYKSIRVKMLGCHQSGKRTYLFIAGVGDYKSFLVTRMGNHKKQKLFITAACFKGAFSFGGINQPEVNYDTKSIISKVESGYKDEDKSIEQSHLNQFL